MAFAAAIPLIASLIPAIGGLFGGGNKEGEGGGGGGNQNLAATHAALGTALASKGGGEEHPVLKGTDLPPTLATVLSGNKSGHVLPHAATAAGKMGRAGVLAPPLEAAIAQIHAKQQTAPVLRHQEKAARASVKRVNESLAPQLQTLAKGMRDRAVQIQATAEHRAIVDRDARWRQMAQKQTAIIQKLDNLTRRLNNRWHV